MKVAIVAESFLPQTNGVVRSILRVIDHLVGDRGDEVLVIAPEDPAGVPFNSGGASIATVPSWAFPPYPEVRVATGRSAPIEKLLKRFNPDVIHLASPFVLGWRATLAAHRLDIPIVAVYQTDVPGFARQYRWAQADKLLWKRVHNIHERAEVNLVPSLPSKQALEEHGINRVKLWRRGVEAERFNPSFRSEEYRRRISPEGRPIVGFVGRVAPEKNVGMLTALAELDAKLMIVGDGPARAKLQSQLPDAHFTGMLHKDDLSRAMANLDVLVHTGETETFCQVIQEAMASGLPVVAPASGGPLDLVDVGRTGWLYEPGNREDLADRVRDLIGDAAKRRAMGEAAAKVVEGRTWRSVCSELVGHYAEAIELHGRLPRMDVGMYHWTTRQAVRSKQAQPPLPR